MNSNLRTVSEEEVPTFGPDGMVDPPRPVVAHPRQPHGAAIAGDAIFLALKALSSRALIALSALADLALIGSAFALWLADNALRARNIASPAMAAPCGW